MAINEVSLFRIIDYECSNQILYHDYHFQLNFWVLQLIFNHFLFFFFVAFAMIWLIVLFVVVSLLFL